MKSQWGQEQEDERRTVCDRRKEWVQEQGQMKTSLFTYSFVHPANISVAALGQTLCLALGTWNGVRK